MRAAQPSNVQLAEEHTQPQQSAPESDQQNYTSVREHLTLRLKPRPRSRKAVKWAEDVVDNEEMNKKKSKKCCIFHAQQKFGQWNDDLDSDDETCEQCPGSSNQLDSS
ncbi:hypothetical protein WJX74_008227 [Apatococcus lobatus]|uniref:Protein phosphatase 1 regulatory subunit 11 n=1 Tax=Apatococcus lobatus TaxID=904363 RepID=A0AAW1RV05_9CHLO